MCDALQTRRGALTMLAAAGATAVAPRSLLAADRPYRIDVHYHHIPPLWIKDDIVQKNMSGQVIKNSLDWTPARAIEDMDRNDIATAVCSVPNPGVWFNDVEKGRRLARVCNEHAATLKQTYPKRFGSFAALPLPDVEGSLAEIDYAFDVLKAEGVGLFSSYEDKWLADTAFAPVFRELSRRKAVVYVHPNPPVCCRKLVPEIPASLIEYPVDSTRTILQWILTKSAALYPDIRLIFSHAGGYVMGGLGRLQLLSDARPDFGLPHSFRDEVAKFHYEISSSADPVTMKALRSYVPASHILLGTDGPYIEATALNIAQLSKLGLPKAELAAIERENALALMPKLA